MLYQAAASLVFDEMCTARLTASFADFSVVCACRYVAVYFSVLYARYRAGVVTRDMLALPKRRFVAIGLLEALGVASGMSAGGSCLNTLWDAGMV
jgi:hypothetical protein